MQTVYLRNPEALRQPQVVNLFREALAKLPGAAPGGFDSCTRNIYDFVADSANFVTVAGVEDGIFTTLMVIALNRGNMLYPYPSVLLLYNKGSKEVRDAVKERALDIVVEKGYTIVHTANMTKHANEIWEKAVGSERLSLTPIGTLYEIRVR